MIEGVIDSVQNKVVEGYIEAIVRIPLPVSPFEPLVFPESMEERRNEFEKEYEEKKHQYEQQVLKLLRAVHLGAVRFSYIKNGAKVVELIGAAEEEELI